MVVTFRGRHKGNLVFWCFKVDFSRQVQGIEAVLRFRFSRSTLGMLVVVEELRFRYRCSEL